LQNLHFSLFYSELYFFPQCGFQPGKVWNSFRFFMTCSYIITLLLIWFYIKSICIVLSIFTSRPDSLLACRIPLLFSKEEVEILKWYCLKIFWINFRSTFWGYTYIFRYHLFSSSLEDVPRPCIVFYNVLYHYSEEWLAPIQP
jgi:hypothetical protein